MRDVVKGTRKRKHVAATMDYIGRCGGSFDKLRQGSSHMQVYFSADGHALMITMPICPKDADVAAKSACQQIRHEMRAVGVEVRA